MQKNLFISAAIVGVLILGACSHETQDAVMVSPPPPAPAAEGDAMVQGTAKEFTIEAKNFSFSLPEIRVKKGDTLKVTVKNGGGAHDWRVDGLNVATKTLTDGQEEVVSFTADTVGQFEYFCSIGNHRQMGMKGVLIVE